MPKKLLLYRRVLIGIFVICTVLLGTFSYLEVLHRLPDEIHIIGGKSQEISLKIPATATLYNESVEAAEMGENNIPKSSIHVNLDKPVTFVSGSIGSYTMQCRLFGVIPLKNVTFNVIDEQKLIPAGIPIGIFVKTKGILVVGTGTVKSLDGNEYEPVYHLLQSGDYIETLNGNEVLSKGELIDNIKHSSGEEIVLGIRRKEKVFDLKVKPIQTGIDEYKIGIWIRDNTQGIGTLTFIDENMNFGALGHGINDVDTSTLMELDNGTLYNTDIISIVKGESGTPGELTGIIDYVPDNVLGEIKKNTTEGIFGVGNGLLYEEIANQPLPIALKQDIELGSAEIICTINGKTESYDINITKVDFGAESVNRGIVIEVVDRNLLAMTGGIVQGMSGSPIIQNGKIVGAVTHVFVQDSTKGFGIFIENMLASMNINEETLNVR